MYKSPNVIVLLVIILTTGAAEALATCAVIAGPVIEALAARLTLSPCINCLNLRYRNKKKQVMEHIVSVHVCSYGGPCVCNHVHIDYAAQHKLK